MAYSTVDGSVEISVNMNIDAAEKALSDLNKKISKIESQLSVDKNKRNVLKANLEAANKEAAELYKKLGQMKYEGIDFSEEARQLQEVEDRILRIEKNIYSVDKKIEDGNNDLVATKIAAGDLVGQIEALKNEVSETEDSSDDLAEHFEDAADSASHIKNEINKTKRSTDEAGKGASRFANRLKSIVAGAFVFNIISRGMKKFVGLLGTTVKSNDQARAAIARLKGALLTLAQPIVDVIIPAFIAFINILTRVINVIASFVSSLFGTTLEKSAQNAKALYNQQKAISGVGSAAKKAGKQLASFDELNQLADTTADASADGGVGDGSIIPDFTGLDDLNADMGDLEEKVEAISPIVAAIGGALLAWKIGSGVVSFFGLFSGASGGFSVPSIGTTLKGLADLVIIVGGVTALVEVLGMFAQIPGFKKNAQEGIEALKIVFWGIAEIAIPLAGVGAAIVILGKIGVGTVVKGLASFALVVDGVPVVITALGALLSIPHFSDFLGTGMDSISTVFNGIGDIAIPLAATAAVIVALGFVSPGVVLSGLAGLALVIGGIETILVVLGALNQIPGFSWIVGEGGKVLMQLGEILGGFVGSIVSGFLDAATEGLVAMADNLADFGTHIQPFFEVMGNVDSSTISAIGDLSVAILKITAAELLEGITRWFTGESSLVNFGDELVEFGPKFAQYAKSVSGITEKTVSESTAAIESVLAYTNNVPNRGGVVSWFTGENTLNGFGEELATFGPLFAKYAKSVSGIKEDVVKSSSAAIESVIAYADKVPNQGGVVSWFTGENKLSDFGEELKTFGPKFAQYAKSVSNITESTVKSSNAAIESVIAYADKVPNQGGVTAWFTGDNKLSDFGKELAVFAPLFVNYANHVNGITKAKLEPSTNAIISIIEFADTIPTHGGFASFFTGDNTMSDFGEELYIFGQYFESYYNCIKNTNAATTNKITDALDRMIDIALRVEDVDMDNLSDFGEDLSDLAESMDKLHGRFKDLKEYIIGSFTQSWKTTWSNFTTEINKAIDNAKSKITELNNKLASIQNAVKINVTYSQTGNQTSTSNNAPYLNRSQTNPSGFSLPIPALATGAVIPPNREFMAVLGDQKRGTNIEAPADLIRSIVREEIGRAGNENGDIKIVFDGDLAALARILNPHIEREQRRMGANFVSAGYSRG